jgi:hypothetical protein
VPLFEVGEEVDEEGDNDKEEERVNVELPDEDCEAEGEDDVGAAEEGALEEGDLEDGEDDVGAAEEGALEEGDLEDGEEPEEVGADEDGGAAALRLAIDINEIGPEVNRIA